MRDWKPIRKWIPSGAPNMREELSRPCETLCVSCIMK